MLLLLQLKYILVYLFVVVGHIYFSWNCTNPIYLNPNLFVVGGWSGAAIDVTLAPTKIYFSLFICSCRTHIF